MSGAAEHHRPISADFFAAQQTRKDHSGVYLRAL
jgi:hypothetical protein